MENVTRAYWKRRTDAPRSDAISGWCGINDIPPHGEVKNEPIPTEVETITLESGTLEVRTPPVLGTRYVYRYVMHINDHWREKISAATTHDDLDLLLGGYGPFRVERAEARQPDTDIENWWWYAKDNFRMVYGEEPVPLRLIKKWKMSMIEILLEGHPLKKQRMENWQKSLEDHKNYTKRKNQDKPKASAKSPGDLVINPHHSYYKSGGVKQIFKFEEVSSHQSRKKYGLYVNGVHHIGPHGKAVKITPAVLGNADYCLPVRLSACLLAWEHSPLRSAHEIISAECTYKRLFEQLLEQLSQYEEEAASLGPRSFQIASKSGQVNAAKSALIDFGDIQRANNSAGANVALRQIADYRAALIERLDVLIDATKCVEEEEETEEA